MTAQQPQPEPTTLAGTLRRVAALDPTLELQILRDLDDAWIRVDQLIVPGNAHLGQLLSHMLRPYRGPSESALSGEQHVAAAFFVNTYAWLLTLVPAACYLTERRVPQLNRASLALRLRDPAEGRGALELALLSKRMTVLPDDPAAGRAECVVVADLPALRDWFRLAVEAHMAPLIEAVRAATGFGRRAQWNLVADDCAGGFLAAGERVDALERACHDGLAFVSAPGSPMLPSRTGYLTLEQGACRQTFRTRGGCCLYYRLPGRASCSTCVVLSAAERDARLRAYMADR